MSSADGRVIVVGSVNVDVVMRLPRLPRPGETVVGGALARHQGGKGANQAVAAARAGAKVSLVGAVGSQDGQDSLAALIAEGVDVAEVALHDGPTGHAIVLVADDGENQIAVAAGANDAVTREHVAHALDALAPLQAGDVVVLSFELPDEPLRKAANAVRSAGARLVVNPAPARAGYADLLTGAIATPNVHELAELLAQTRAGAAPDPRSGSIALARRTGAPVIVTLGADGVLLASEDSAEHLAGHRVQAVDTTGAGDTLTGVLAAGLAQGHSLRECVRRAVAAAALAVTMAGAREGMPTRAAIDKLAGQGT